MIWKGVTAVLSLPGICMISCGAVMFEKERVVAQCYSRVQPYNPSLRLNIGLSWS
jgi:hypothetical protein